MKRIFFILTFASAILLTVPSCQKNRDKTQSHDEQEPDAKTKKPVKMIDYLPGEWRLTARASGVNDPKNHPGQMLTFTQEARYIVREDNRKIDSGAYRMNEQLHNLYFESEANANPREYEVGLREDTLTLIPKQDAQGRVGGQYVYVRSK